MSFEKLQIVVEKDPQYRTFYATGAYGGVTPRAELEMHFYQDMTPLPKAFNVMVSPEGKVGETNIETEARGRRVFHAGVTMPISEIPNLIQWLQSKLDEYHSIMGHGE